MTDKQIITTPKTRVKALEKIETKAGLEAALAYNDTVSSIRAVNDTIKEKWVGYVDPAGNHSSSPNSFMTLRKNWNRKFGINSVKELIGDVEKNAYRYYVPVGQGTDTVG